MTTRIININDGKPYNIDIGRSQKRFHYGNPFSHRDYDGVIKVSNRTEAIRAFKDWLLGIRYEYVEQGRRQWILENMEKDLKGKVLGCWCKPKSCHGDIYIELLSDGNMEKYL